MHQNFWKMLVIIGALRRNFSTVEK